jgi:multidrug efflux pump subunit AcrB
MYRAYAGVMGPLLDRSVKAWGLLLLMLLLFLGACSLAVFRLVPLKMLPFDNKNELQIMVNPPEGTTLEQTDSITRQFAELLQKTPEVKDFEIYSGLSSAMDFNGMIRHYYLRNAPHVADIRVNLIHKEKREMKSHEISLRLRHDLEAIASQSNARIAIIESPPGPPVLSTITAEIYADPGIPYEQLRNAARRLENRLQAEAGVADVDSTVEDPAERLLFNTDREKAALSGVSVSDIAQTTALSLAGLDVARMHFPGEVNPLPIRLRLPRDARSDLDGLKALVVKGLPGIGKIRESGGTRDAPVPIIRLGELGSFENRQLEKAVYHKDLRPVVFVYAEAVGIAPAEIVADIEADRQETEPQGKHTPKPVAERHYLSNGGGLPWSLPEGTRISWLGEGELNITRDAFRDLGIAFAAAQLFIYFILIYQTRSYSMPMVLMISIPLSLIGILPGFWLLNKLFGEPVSGYGNPTFFTATAMIGMIAVSGLAVRNAILLIEFLHTGLARGLPLKEAILEAGAVRTRAILLTTGTAMLSAIPIAFDPVFSGLAWALIFGLLVSTVFTLFVVPVAYNLMYRNKPGHGLPLIDREQNLS